jgi:hyperosmotically inducible periplasmic protein
MKKLMGIIAILTLALYLPACKSKVKDADIKTTVEKTLISSPGLAGLTVDVKDGVATVSGEVKTDAERAAVETTLKGVKGVKSVVNNTTVAVPPPVVNADDETLARGLADALKDNPTVSSSVVDGKIVLTGEIAKAKWVALKQTLDKLKSKGYDLAGLKIK